MQSTTLPSTIALRISPSPLLLLLMLPLARMTTAVPLGARWWRMCCNQAKFALPAGGTPYFQRRSEEHTSELQSRGHLVCRLLLEKKKNEQHLYVNYAS